MIFNRVFALPIVCALALSGCVDPNSTENRSRNGVIIGAALGGLLGATAGDGNDRLGRTLVGAGIGAAAGGLIGQQLDRQAEELRRDLGGNVDIRNTGETLVLTLPQDILFATDSAVVRPDLQRDLRTIAANLQSNPSSTIKVIGHTDNTGTANHNLQLSERRAGSVAAILRDSGVSGNRIEALGWGQTQPAASNATPAGRALNRRVEIIIRPN
jgi:outer membrane protein OmpA-like peptidoglycan-associated protein